MIHVDDETVYALPEFTFWSVWIDENPGETWTHHNFFRTKAAALAEAEALAKYCDDEIHVEVECFAEDQPEP